ncbi:LytTR family DNA-binding domain-containing protein [Chryseolinea sp. T2]|uniref:LytR/AlgR family response regulator transcription factor n=1 Tax=Chryseolinea sp. T2 TaxID=3129255 RepID=UPI003078381D
MKRISCLVVEDEPASQEILRKYINDFPQLECRQYCSNAFEAADVLRTDSVDLIFLDINMPRLSGMQFYRSLVDPPAVIFTTAYAEHAAEGFDVNAVDYLVKPFPFDRFIKAVNKFIDLTESKPGTDEYILLMADKKMHKVYLSSILFAEGMSDYVKVHTEKMTLIVLMTLQKLQEQLPPTHFKRIHRSFIISLGRLEYIDGNFVVIDKHQIPIGQTYRSEFLTFLQQRSRC